MHFSFVEQPAFKELVVALNPHIKVISTLTVRTRIEESANQMRRNVILQLSEVSYVATTTD